MPRSNESNPKRTDPTGPTRRQFMVSIAGVMAGAFSLPLAPGMTEGNATYKTIRKLLAPPTRQSKGRGAGHVLVWMEDNNGETVVMSWEPETPQEVEEARRFYEAAHHYQDGPIATEAREGAVGKIGRLIKKMVSPPAKRGVEEELLLERIREDDTQEAAWVAYARWLDAKKDPLGEFIRVVWQLEHVPEGDPARDPLDERWRKLIDQHSRKWLAPLAKLGLKPMVGADLYYPALWLIKGFPTELQIDKPGILPERAGEFFAAAPLVTALQIELDPFDVPALMNTAEMKQIRGLAIGSAIQAPEDLAALLASTNLPNLRSLELSYWGISPAGIAALAESELLGQLETLNLTGCDVDDAAIGTLVGSPRVAKLKRLVLNNNDIEAEGARAIARSPHLGALRELDLGDNHFGDEGAVALAGMPCLSRLMKLILEDCGVGEEGATALGKAGFPKLEELDLSANPLGAGGLAALLPALSKARLKTLNISRAELGTSGVEHLTRLPGLVLEELNLNRNNLQDAGMTPLAQWRKCPPLKRLELIENQIGDAGARSLADGPLLTGVTHLRLDENPIGDAGAKALAASAYLGRLKDLFLSKKVGKPGREAIKKRFGADVGCFD